MKEIKCAFAPLKPNHYRIIYSGDLNKKIGSDLKAINLYKKKYNFEMGLYLLIKKNKLACFYDNKGNCKKVFMYEKNIKRG